MARSAPRTERPRLSAASTCAGALRPDTSVSPCFQGQVGACTAPCAARVDAGAYRQQVEACLAFLDGDVTWAEGELARRRDALAAECVFEAAGRAQRDLDLLQKLVRRQRFLGWVVEQQNFLVLQPVAGRGAVCAYVVLAGRLAARARLQDPAHLESLVAPLAPGGPLACPRRLSAEDVDGTTILAAWLRNRGERDGYVCRIEDATRPTARMAEWQAACAELLAPAARRHEGSAPETEGDGQRGEQPGTVGAAAGITD